MCQKKIVTEFTYQVWVKPYSVHSNTRQGIMGEIVDKSGIGQYYNSGLHIINSTLYFLAGSYWHVNKSLFSSLSLPKSPSFHTCVFAFITAVFYSVANLEYKWFHVTASFNKNEVNGTARLFINGELVTEKQNLGPCLAVNMPFYIAFSDASDLFSGQLDEIRLWK